MTQPSQCCGCTACRMICPARCITMKPDPEGFLYPEVDSERCLRCHRCQAVCPIQNPPVSGGSTQTWVGYARSDAIRSQSSSGGIFTLAAEAVLKQGGVIFGAAFDDTFGVHHICVETQEDLGKLRGSKYVQSDLEDTFVQAKGYLKDGRWVLFTGTACQIGGLRAYLGRDYQNLLTIDVLCHGVPSPKIWRLYLQEQQRKFGAKITSIRLRDKQLGWRQYSIAMAFDNGQAYCVPFHQDPYMDLFLGNIDLRPSCHNCRFKAFPRASDMTIGDCWGIERQIPEMDDDRGTSVILVHTPRGQALLQTILPAMELKKAELDSVLPPWADSRRSVDAHPNRKKFWLGVARGEGLDILRKYTRRNLLQRCIAVLRHLGMRAGLLE